MYPEALAVLDSIPDTTQDNADFKTIYFAYIQLLTGGSGKNSDATFALHQAEQNQLDARQTLGQRACLPCYKAIAMCEVLRNNSTILFNKTNKHKLFAPFPNPANDLVTIQFYQPLAAKEYLYMATI